MGINRASGSKRLGILAAALNVLSLANPATAQYLTFVSATGNDANNCLVQASPCKTLQRAINATAARGEVRLLSRLVSTGFINKSITIDGAGNTIVGTITINSASAVVTLRGLGLNGRGGYANGIRITSAAAVHIEHCTVERYTSDAIQLVATTATKLFILNTVSRDNVGNGDGLYVDAVNAQVVIQNSRFEQNGSSGVFIQVANASVTGSDASVNAAHGFILLTARAKITETTADNNSGDGFAARAGTVVLNSAEAHGNGAAGLHVEAGTSARMSDCVYLGASTPGVLNQSVLFTRENNTVVGYSGTNPTSFGAY